MGLATAHSRRIFRWRLSVAGLVLLTGIVALMAVCVGAVRIPLPEVVEILWRAASGDTRESIDTHAIILLELRIPRLVMAMLVGTALAVAGAVYQSMLRNPLADPYLLGVASGGAVGAVIALVLGWAFIPLVAFLGALISAVIVVVIAYRRGSLHPHTLILAGVVVNAFLSSVIALTIAFSSSDATRGIVFWLMGRISTERIATIGFVAICVVGSTAALYWKAGNLDLLAQGDSVAKQLGLEVERYKWFLIIVTSLLTAIAVAYNGLIGFVGFIVPHIGRFLFGADNRFLIPVSALLGAMVMVVADTLARTVIAPSELPVGAITALAGGPFFLLLLRKAHDRFT